MSSYLNNYMLVLSLTQVVFHKSKINIEDIKRIIFSDFDTFFLSHIIK